MPSASGDKCDPRANRSVRPAADHPVRDEPAKTPDNSRSSGGEPVSDVTHEADPSSPGGSASPGAGVSSRRVVEQLDEAACLELLSTGRIGRLIYNSRYDPVPLPSHYKHHAGPIC